MPKTVTKAKLARQPKKTAEAKSGAMTVTLPQPPTAEAIYNQIVKSLPTPRAFQTRPTDFKRHPLLRRRGLQRGVDGRGHARLCVGDIPLRRHGVG